MLTWFLVAIHFISILLLSCICQRDEYYALRRLSLIRSVLCIVSLRILLLASTVLMFFWYIWLTIWDMKNDVPHPSLRANASAANNDVKTRFILDKFHAMEQYLFLRLLWRLFVHLDVPLLEGCGSLHL